MIENIKQFANDHRTLIVVILGVLVICFLYWWFFCKDRPSVNKVKGGDPDTRSIVILNGCHFSCIGLMFIFTCEDDDTGGYFNLGIPLLNKLGVDYMISNKDTIMNEGIISEIYREDLLCRIISNPCSVLFSDCGDDDSTINYLFNSDGGLVSELMKEIGKDGKIDFNRFLTIEDETIREKFEKIRDLYIGFVKRIMAFDDEKISIANYIGQVGGEIGASAQGRDIIGSGDIKEKEELMGFVDLDEEEDDDESDAEGMTQVKSEQSSFNKKALETTEAYYNSLDKGVRDWYKNKFSFYSQFLKKYSLSRDNEIFVDKFELTSSSIIIKLIKKTFFVERILKNNKQLICDIAESINEQENIRALLSKKFKELIDFENIRGDIESVFQKTSESVCGSEDEQLNESEIAGRIAGIFTTVNEKLKDGINIEYKGKQYSFKYVKMKESTLSKIYEKLEKGVESSCFDVADIYPAQKVILFVLYICNNLYKSENVEDLENFKNEIASFMIVVQLFNSFCACYMGNGWNRRLRNEYVYNYIWKGMEQNINRVEDQLISLLGKKLGGLIVNSDKFKEFLKFNSGTSKNIFIKSIIDYTKQSFVRSFSIKNLDENYNGEEVIQLICETTKSNDFIIHEYFSTAVNCMCSEDFLNTLSEVSREFVERNLILDEFISDPYDYGLSKRGINIIPTSNTPFLIQNSNTSATCALYNILFDVDTTGLVSEVLDDFEYNCIPNGFEMCRLINNYGLKNVNNSFLLYYHKKISGFIPSNMDVNYLILLKFRSDYYHWIGIKYYMDCFLVYDSNQERPVEFNMYTKKEDICENYRIISVIEISKRDAAWLTKNIHGEGDILRIREDLIDNVVGDMGCVMAEKVGLINCENDVYAEGISPIIGQFDDNILEQIEIYRYMDEYLERISGENILPIFLWLNFTLLLELKIMYNVSPPPKEKTLLYQRKFPPEPPSILFETSATSNRLESSVGPHENEVKVFSKKWRGYMRQRDRFGDIFTNSAAGNQLSLCYSFIFTNFDELIDRIKSKEFDDSVIHFLKCCKDYFSLFYLLPFDTQDKIMGCPFLQRNVFFDFLIIVREKNELNELFEIINDKFEQISSSENDELMYINFKKIYLLYTFNDLYNSVVELDVYKTLEALLYSHNRGIVDKEKMRDPLGLKDFIKKVEENFNNMSAFLSEVCDNARGSNENIRKLLDQMSLEILYLADYLRSCVEFIFYDESSGMNVADLIETMDVIGSMSEKKIEDVKLHLSFTIREVEEKVNDIINQFSLDEDGTLSPEDDSVMHPAVSFATQQTQPDDDDDQQPTQQTTGSRRSITLSPFVLSNQGVVGNPPQTYTFPAEVQRGPSNLMDILQEEPNGVTSENIPQNQGFQDFVRMFLQLPPNVQRDAQQFIQNFSQNQQQNPSQNQQQNTQGVTNNDDDDDDGAFLIKHFPH